MTSRRRLTRQQLKQKDQVLTGMEAAVETGLGFLERHPGAAWYIPLAIVLVLVLGIGSIWLIGSRVEAANRGLSEVARLFEGEQDPELGEFESEEQRLQATLDRAGQVAESYPLTGASKAARMYEAASLERLGRPQEALERYLALAGKSPSNMLEVSAALAAARVYEITSQEDQAEQLYRSLLAARGLAVAPAQVLLRIGELQERRERSAEAIESYQRLLDEHPDAPEAAQARARLDELSQAEEPVETP